MILLNLNMIKLRKLQKNKKSNKFYLIKGFDFFGGINPMKQFCEISLFEISRPHNQVGRQTL